ncbi:peptide deformylase [Xenorhabdus nematophila]|uniref:Peptide deformylase n=1 Tax=Xenorhabdus nematophila (strain ATCC 19061 / DSM 3370 / CCUG 14189 / LMG 1036 / NCIMB 9965 / AN6) TaxID=406817 RepID=D3V8R0_XENNA|nr:peptide deformylase [Xenorhabdus nematophila]CEE93620.1 peptide deformylase [Xenorhabdus nematophila str. Anatoliense]CEF30874.1 peptide deformylase [Xenorhabdus nematophila str. Websteri]AYA40919.1 peptide deformylase [Xenorhabdus nematophila]KHD28550.1 peptide deformylase [Xenorhabdus nematophila]MBA0019668.1 peptide deformylase [Xenorhabdus nematophila]
MAILDILTIPDERLRQKCVDVTDFDKVQTLVDDMLETMYATDNGIGLAAPQVGRKEAVLVIDLSPDRDKPTVLVNPKIVEKERRVVNQEGCLSIPGYYADVERFEKVKVEAFDRQGNQTTIESEDFLSIVMQHEIDHLNGVIFIDYLSPLRRKMALKKVQKYISNRNN